MVLGPADVGKSSFIRAAAAAHGGPPQLLDLDPGQKMVGPPGTVSLGRTQADRFQLTRFRFIGSTSAAQLRQLVDAARELAGLASARGPFIANSSGFVRGLGARLQSATIEAIGPDLIVAISTDDGLDHILSRIGETPLVRIAPSPLARRKTNGERRQVRQYSLDEELAGAERLSLPPQLPFSPAPPAKFGGVSRPLCALADASGNDMRLGVLKQATEEALIVIARTPSSPPAQVKLGKLWVEPVGDRWRLMERLDPAWTQPS